jgi:hypothetical protein
MSRLRAKLFSLARRSLIAGTFGRAAACSEKKGMLMKYILVILLAAAVATPATAANTKKKQRVYQQEQQLQAQGLRHSRNSWDVYSPDGRFIGRDPSPNVRQRLYDDERIRNGE